jgi:succinate-semialdehyde dehydrogenase/glutarate-semialdehyde dehydrogenase
MTVEDTEEAIQRAYVAFGAFSRSTPQSRANILQAFHELVKANEEDIAVLISLENGKSFNDALAEVHYGASYLQWNAGEALRMYGRTIPSSLPGTRNLTRLEVSSGVTLWLTMQPVGVVAALCPWNFPVGMICRKTGPALAVGCSVVIKVPAETPFSVLALVEVSVDNYHR